MKKELDFLRFVAILHHLYILVQFLQMKEVGGVVAHAVVVGPSSSSVTPTIYIYEIVMSLQKGTYCFSNRMTYISFY
jgi:hypothetical protein